MKAFLGIDTSNYTTSAAIYRDDNTGLNASRLLDVPEGALGLRQSDALFQHVRRLPDQIAVLEQAGMLTEISAVGASSAPRTAEGSYMPCFLAGLSQGRILAQALHVPFFECSHQQGHVAAAAWSAGRIELLDKPMLSWHLSGGTTELLFVYPEHEMPQVNILGGTEDISAGQLIDRTGKKLGISFPAGKGLDALASKSNSQELFPVKVRGLRFSLSGVENQVQKRIDAGMAEEDVARFVLNTLAAVIDRVTHTALERYPGLPILMSGGVASNALLRKTLDYAYFAQPQYSTDNAMGVAVLTSRAMERGVLHA